MIYSQDLRYAGRLLGRSPGFTLLTVLVLAGGIGVSTFTFSFLYTAMIRPLPLEGGDRIVRLMRVEDGRHRPVDAADVPALAAMQTARDLGGYAQREVLVGRDGQRRVLTVTACDPALFEVAQTPSLLGRTLQPADAAAGAAPVMVLAFRTWQTVFGADRAVLDTDLVVNGTPTRVVGVMPAGFGFPVTQDAWLPLPARADGSLQAGREFLSVFARLAPGATAADAAAEATTIVQRQLAARATPGQPARSQMLVESFPAAQIGDERLLVFTGLNLLAALVLLLSIVNVTTLLTARANERIRETAVRLALGASTGRLVVQSMWEGAILCVAAGILGTAGAAWGLDAVTSWTRAHLEGNLAFWWVWRADRVTLLASGALVTLAIAVLGTVVSRRATSTNVREVLQDGGVRSGSRREGRLARRLVATQVATVTVLMFVGVVSGVLAYRVVAFDPGYDPSRLLQAVLAPSADRFTTDEARDAVFRSALAQLDEHAAIDAVLIRRTIGTRGEGTGAFAVRGQQRAGALPTASIAAVLGDLSTVGVSLVAGRALEPGDDGKREPVAVISQSLSARVWPGSSPLGRQLRAAGLGDAEGWRTIVGVVSDVPQGNPFSRDRSPEAIYVPLLQSAETEANVLVRHHGSDVAGRQALVDVFAAIDPQSIPQHVQSTEEVLRKSTLITTATTKLVGACFAFALLLAVVGTYGLMSRSIGLRTREIAVRRALGATDGTATRMLLEQGARQLGVGTVAAAPILAALGTATVHALPVSATLTATVGVVVSAAILAVVLAATWLPARRTLRVPLREALGRE